MFHHPRQLSFTASSLQLRHNGHDSVSNHQPHDCFLNRLFRRRPKKTSKLRVIGLCAGNSPRTDEFHAQMASNAENVSIWWRVHVYNGTLSDAWQCLWRFYKCHVLFILRDPIKLINGLWFPLEKLNTDMISICDLLSFSDPLSFNQPRLS